MRRPIGLLGIPLALALVAGACGDDGDGGVSVDDPLVQAIVAEILAETEGLTDDRGEAECFATGVVGGIGQDRLDELGVSATNIGELDELAWTQGEAELIVDELFGCTDVEDGFAVSFVNAALSDEEGQCVDAEIGEDRIREFFVGGLLQEEPTTFFEDMTAAFEECGLDLSG